MPQMKETRQPPPPPSRGNTEVAQGENQAPKAREPHERDESADSQKADAESIRRMGALAHESQAAGQRDTTKGVEMDQTYHRMRETAEPAPQDKVNQPRRDREDAGRR